jgi:hypothetical protein
MHRAALAFAAVTLASSIPLARAEAPATRPWSGDDDRDQRPRWELGLGVHGIAMAQIGRWNALAMGFEGLAGVRVGRVAILAEGQLMALWPATWARGTIALPGVDAEGEPRYVEGSMQRIALDARISLVRAVGRWSHRRALEQLAVHDLFVEAGVGREWAQLDRGVSFSRPDVTLGIGGSMGARMRYRDPLRRHTRGGYFSGYYIVRVLVAPGVPTPGGDLAARCASACGGAPGALDIGVSFDFGLAFGG